jgi:hypothetical protein
MIELSGTSIAGVVALSFMLGYGWAILIRWARNRMP